MLHGQSRDGIALQSPAEEKFRRIKVSNAAFESRVGSMQGATEFLRMVGFEPDSSGAILEMPQEKVSREVLSIAGSELHGAMTNPYFGML